MRQITFQFAADRVWTDVVSAGIRLRTDCQYSHVDIVVPHENLLGARLKGGVLIRKPGYAKFTKTMRMSVIVSDDIVFDAGYNWLLNQVGKPYDRWAIAGLALHRDWREEDKWFCSELAFRFAEKCGAINLSADAPDLRVNWLSPRDLILVLAALRKGNYDRQS